MYDPGASAAGEMDKVREGNCPLSRSKSHIMRIMFREIVKYIAALTGLLRLAQNWASAFATLPTLHAPRLRISEA